MAIGNSNKVGEAYVEVKADLTSLKSSFKKMQRDTDAKLSTMGKTSGKKFATGFIGAMGAVMLFKKAFDFTIQAKNAARDAQETRSKFDTVFSSMQQGANDTADAFAKSFGVAGTTARELLGNTGDLLVGFGFAEDRALSLSKEVNSLAQDLASFTNFAGGAKGASNALTKAILGETESAKALGIVLKQNTPEFRAQMKDKVKNQGLTENQARAEILLAEAYKQSTKAVGDYARTKDSLANVERRLTEQTQELMEQIGNEVVPVFQTVLVFFASFNSELQESKGSLSVIGGIANVVGTAFIGVATVLKHIGTLMGGVVASLVHLATGEFASAGKAISMTFSKIKNNSIDGYESIIKMWEATTNSAKNYTNQSAKVDIAVATTQSSFEKATKSVNAYRVAMEQAYNEKLLKQVADAQFQFQQFGKGFGDLDEKGLERDKSKKDIPKELETVEQDVADPLINASKQFEGNMQGALGTADSIANLLGRALGEGAESFVTALQSGISIVAQVLGIVGSFTPGGAIASLFAHDGGTFSGGVKSASFAGGTDGFIVPNGYPRDSFRVNVQSGEELKVTPASQVGKTDQLLSGIQSSIQALTMNMMDKGDKAPIVNVMIDKTSLTEDAIMPTKSKLLNQGVKFNEF